ncbi:MAG: lipopolysaccharide biosynthesis protein [Bacteroidales bacterium]|nr:lipopolysaccharide biosynthesis protein [Bacteroidales bacterium]
MDESTLKGKTAKGLFWGGMSNGAQQLLNLFFGIFLARILNAEDYGMVGMLTIFTVIAGSLQESGFTNALVNKKDASHKDFNAVFWFSTLLGVTLYIILFFCAPLIAQFYHKPELTPLARFLFLGFLMSSTATAHNAILFKRLMVKQKAIAQITGLTISGIVGVTMAFNGMAYWGIATQSVVNIMITNALFWYFSPWRPTLSINLRPLKQMFEFSSKILVTNIFIQTNNNIFSLLLGRLFSTAEVGYYTQANKWDNMGYSLIGNMVNGVAQPVLTAVSDDQDRQRNVFRKMLRFTSFISFPAMFGLALVAHELIVIAVTDKWLPCVTILQWLCIWGAFFPITTLYTNLIISKGKSNIYMWNTIALGVLQLVALLFAHPYGIQTMIITFVLINVGWLFIWQYFVWRLLRLTLIKALKDILPFAFFALATMAVTYFITLNVSNIYLVFTIKIIIATAIYIFTMWVTNSVVFKESMQFLLNRKK